jgi:hypothetical protein
MWAMLVEDVCEFTRPMYSSMSLGLLPADWMRVGCGMRVGMGSKSVTRRRVLGNLSAELNVICRSRCYGHG